MNGKIVEKLLWIWVIIIVTILLTSCAALAPMVADVLTPGEPALGIDTEIVAGDKNQAVTGSVKNTALTTEKADTINMNDGVPFWQVGVFGIICLAAGLFLPQFQLRRK